MRSFDEPWPATTRRLVLYAMAMVVGPRLLVSLLDARTGAVTRSELTTFDQ